MAECKPATHIGLIRQETDSTDFGHDYSSWAHHPGSLMQTMSAKIRSRVYAGQRVSFLDPKELARLREIFTMC